MNVNAEEAFLYICEGMSANNARWVKHKVIKEHLRGSLGIVNLVSYFNEKRKQHQEANRAKYTIKELHNSNYFKNWCEEYKVKKMSYPDFSKTFVEFREKYQDYMDKLLDTSVASIIKKKN